MWGKPKTLSAGDRAPAVSFRDERGGLLPLAQLVEEGPVLLAFFKTTCPTCQLALPFLRRLHGSGIRVFLISQDDNSRTSAFQREFDAPDPALYDPADDGYPASNSFGITHVPSMFLVEPGGAIGWSSVGFIKSEMEELGGRAGRVLFSDADRVPLSKPG
jgi:peroxiredoxin